MSFQEFWLCHWGGVTNHGPVCFIFVLLCEDGLVHDQLSFCIVLLHPLSSHPLYPHLIVLYLQLPGKLWASTNPTMCFSAPIRGQFRVYPILNLLPSHVLVLVALKVHVCLGVPLCVHIWLTLLFLRVESAKLWHPPGFHLHCSPCILPQRK